MPAPLRGDALASVLYGKPTLLGCIVATTTKNNNDTAAPFNNTGDALKGKTLLLQPDSACHVAFGTVNTVTVANSATAGGVKLAADERFYISMGEDTGWIACIIASGGSTTNLRVYEMK